METTGWLHRSLADVPPGDDWLTGRERSVLSRLAIAPRRLSWRLGRFTAKAAIAGWLGGGLELAPERAEVIAAADGAPEPWLDGRRLPASLSLSHRGADAIAAIAGDPCVVGCDLEIIEPRSDAFIADWLAADEQRLVQQAGAGDAPLVANLIWTAKEAAAKVRREGLRLDVREAVVAPDLEAASGGWRAVEVRWPTARVSGWWRREGDLVFSIVSDPAGSPPRELEGRLAPRTVGPRPRRPASPMP